MARGLAIAEALDRPGVPASEVPAILDALLQPSEFFTQYKQYLDVVIGTQTGTPDSAAQGLS